MGSLPPYSCSKSSLSICRLLLFGVLGLLLPTSFISFYSFSATATLSAVAVLSAFWVLASSRDTRRPAKTDPSPSQEAKVVVNKLADLHGMLPQLNYDSPLQTDSGDFCDPSKEGGDNVLSTVLMESSATGVDPAKSVDDISVSELIFPDSTVVYAGGCDEGDDDNSSWRQCYEGSMADDDMSSRQCSDGSISDDDSLIEIALADGHPLVHWEEADEKDEALMYIQPPKGPTTAPLLPTASTCRGLIRSPEPFSSKELQFLYRHGLIELLSEIGEEENLIEIDINMGSIKYPGLGGIRA